MYRMAEFSLWIYFLLVLIPFVSSNSSWQTLINTARCRSFCVKQFLFTQEKTRDRKCSKIPDCARCWFMCEEMYNLYDPVCDPSQCCHSVCVVYGTTYGPCSSMHSCKCGCQTACFFRYGLEKRNFLPLRSRHAWKFSKPKISDNGRVLRVTWKRPVPREIGVSNSTLVYVLLARETGSRYWHEVMQTATTSAGVKTGVLPNQAEFKIVAINETGLIGQIVAKKKRIGNRLTAESYLTQPDRPVNTLSMGAVYDVSVRVERHNGTLKAVIQWPNKGNLYYMSYGFDDCNIYRNIPRCNATVDEFNERAIPASSNQNEKSEIEGLLFNSLYWVDIISRSPNVEYRKEMFTTPNCQQTDSTYKRCFSNEDEDNKMKEIERMPGTEPRSTNLDIKNPMDTEIKLKVENETVRAIVRWPNKAQEYIVMYAPIEIDPRLCPADTIDEHQKKVKFMKDGFEDIFHLTDPLQYNARYWLQVKGLKPSLEYDSVEFKTPACETPDDTCTKCKPNVQVTRTGDGPDPNQIRVKTDRSEGIATAYITWNGTTSKYRVNWGIEEANKQCESDMGDYREARVFGNGTKPMKFPRLMFGARYWVEIKNMMTGASYPKKVFKTPFCANLDPSCLTCRQEDDIEPEYPLEVTVTKGPVWSKEKGKVLVSISWQNITHHKTLYTVKWAAIELQKSSTHVQSVSGTTAPTNRTSIQLTLLPDLFYKVEVEATFNDEKGYTHIKSSDVKTVNTTMPSQLPINAAGKSDMSTIIIIVVTVGLLAAALIAFIIIYRRYKGEIAIVKTVAANSNSYKSSYAEGMIRRTPLNFLVSRQANRPELLVTVKDEWEIEHSDLVLGHVLGQGAFGKVIVGELSEQTVAVKVLKDNVPLSYKEDFLQEIALMKKLGPHPHIVSLIGACTLRDPVTLVLEYMPHGNLQNFLKKCRLQGTISLTDDGIQELEYEDDGINWVISASDMLSFARQVAMAMEYIVEKKFVHRDLAARNILVGPNKFVKLCDFGLSRDVYGTNLYHKVTNGKLPLKWMALESLRDRIFTTYSDIWSYGILLYEIATLGGSPYPNIALADLYTMLCRGYRMDKPSNCSPELYETMVQCWDERPLTRPSFTAIREKLEDLMVLDKDYLRLDNIDVPVNPCDNTSDLENDSPSEGEQQEECTPLTIDTDNVEPYLESIPAIVIESTSV